MFLVDHYIILKIFLGKVKELMNSPVIVDGKNLFDGGEGIVYLGIGRGEW